ncbi:hypothetical protein PM082_015743 [Marasmius tenuissimus]|nr:hypothetical protein PM082_015743 [Marasmius tenuissimus]
MLFNSRYHYGGGHRQSLKFCPASGKYHVRSDTPIEASYLNVRREIVPSRRDTDR